MVTLATRSPLPLLVLVALPLPPAACDEGDELQLPAAPDVSGLEMAYQLPGGSLEPEQLACAAADALEQSDGQHLAQLRAAMTETLATLRQRLLDLELPVEEDDEPDDEAARVRAWLRLVRTCRGWDPTAPTPDPVANGTIEVTAVVDEGKLAKVMWGAARGCRERIQLGNAAPVELFFEGNFALALDRGLPEVADQTGFIFELHGQVGVGQARAMVDVDFKVSFPLLELRLPRPDGDVIAGIGPDGVTLRARNGSFTAAPEDCVATRAGRSTAP